MRRSVLLAISLWLGIVSLSESASAQQIQNLCEPQGGLTQLCDESFFLESNISQNIPGGDPETVAVSHKACRLANSIAGRPVLDESGTATVQTRCWSCDALEAVATSANAVVEKLPATLVCADPDNCQPGSQWSLLMKVFIPLGMIAAAVGAGIGIVRREPPIKEFVFLIKYVCICFLIIFIGTEFSKFIWEAVLAALSFGSRIAYEFRNLAPGTGALDWVCTSTPQGWERFMPGLYAQIQGSVEILASFVAIVWPFMPDFSLEKFGSILTSLGTGIIIDFAKVFITVAMLSAAAITVIVYLVAVIEAIILSAMIVGVSPIVIWLAAYEPTKSAVQQSVAGIAYCFFLLIIIGVALAVSNVVMQLTLEVFVQSTLIQSQQKDIALNACTGNFSQYPGIWPKINEYLCLYAYNLDAPQSVTSSHSRTSFLWLPSALFLVIGGFFVKAVGNYAQAGATEISGFGTGQGDTAKGITGKIQKGQGMVTSGISKVAKMF